MPSIPTLSLALSRAFAALAVILIVKVTLSVLLDYRHYFPPDFAADFLRGREAYFWGAYRWAFVTHLVLAPASLLFGTILIGERFRIAFPAWHRRLGRVQVACILLFVTPSGLWMAPYRRPEALRVLDRFAEVSRNLAKADRAKVAHAIRQTVSSITIGVRDAKVGDIAYRELDGELAFHEAFGQ